MAHQFFNLYRFQPPRATGFFPPDEYAGTPLWYIEACLSLLLR